jgi:hypothetical protein|tara:strand:+ start:1346 stop:1684 length:339 start_codon:yes stop_codon:yes gene_type:complete
MTNQPNRYDNLVTTLDSSRSEDTEVDTFDLIMNNNPLIAHEEIKNTHQYNYNVEEHCGSNQYDWEYWQRRYLAELNTSLRLDNRIFRNRYKKYHSKAQSNSSKSNFKGRNIK